jgi:hypothetical protein
MLLKDHALLKAVPHLHVGPHNGVLVLHISNPFLPDELVDFL